MTEFKVGDHTYRAARLNAMQQLQVVRRLSPVLVGLGMGAENSQAAENPLSGLGPVADVLAKLADADVEYVINACLSVVQRQDGKAWHPIMSNGVNMYSADMDLMTMLSIVKEVGQANLSSFTSTLRSLGVLDRAAQA